MALPNLTREQAVERAALVTVDNYRIALDLTDGEGKPGEGKEGKGAEGKEAKPGDGKGSEGKEGKPGEGTRPTASP